MLYLRPLDLDWTKLGGEAVLIGGAWRERRESRRTMGEDGVMFSPHPDLNPITKD